MKYDEAVLNDSGISTLNVTENYFNFRLKIYEKKKNTEN